MLHLPRHPLPAVIAVALLSPLATLSAQSRPYVPRGATVRQVQAEVDAETEVEPELVTPGPAVAPSWSPDRPKPSPVAPSRSVPTGRSWQTKQRQYNSMPPSVMPNAMPRGTMVRSAPSEMPPPARTAPSPAFNRSQRQEPLLADGVEYDGVDDGGVQGYEQIAPPMSGAPMSGPRGRYPQGQYAEGDSWPDGAPYGQSYGGNCQGCESCECGPQCGGCCCDDGCGCIGAHGLGKSLGFGRNHCYPQSLAVFGGVEGFTGNISSQGNFGFHEGLNLSGAMFPGIGVGYQVGMNFTQTNLNNDYSDSRNQVFVTAGLYHRACCQGLQGGVVFDYLHDDFFIDVDLSQIRAELSYVGPWRGEIGAWTAMGNNNDAGVTNPGIAALGFAYDYRALDMYALFFRKTFGNGSNARLWGGGTGEGDGLFGGDLNVQFNAKWGLAANFNYLIPQDDTLTQSNQEGWNVGFSVVWYPGCGAPGCSVANPLFRVADNGSLMIDGR